MLCRASIDPSASRRSRFMGNLPGGMPRAGTALMLRCVGWGDGGGGGGYLTPQVPA